MKIYGSHSHATGVVATFVFLLVAANSDVARALNIAITGTSQGIGLDAAKRLIADGHTVFHACRDEDRASVAVQESGGGIPMVCDLADLESVKDFANKLRKQAPKLDVLCLNAGIAPSRKASAPKLTKDGYEECIGVNHLGHFLLANLLKDHLEKDGGGRLIVTASSVHDPESPGGTIDGKSGATLGDLSGLGVKLDDQSSSNPPTMVDGSIEYDGAKVYNDSKLCNVLFCREAQKRWGPSDGSNSANAITIRSLNPGFIPSSGLFRAPREDNWLGATAFTFVAGAIGIAVPIEIGGARLAYMALADETDAPSGSYYSTEPKSKAIKKSEGFDQASISKEASDDALAARLWDSSAEILGVNA